MKKIKLSSSMLSQKFSELLKHLHINRIGARMPVVQIGLITCAFGTSLLFGVSCTKQKQESPNIIIIFTDDQGYGDLNCYGSETINTPNIDRLAENGIRFTDFHVAASVCTPSRASLLTGCYAKRVGLSKILFPDGTWGRKPNIGINSEEETLAELLKQNGYATAMAGKWHLGHMKDFLPMQHGFDSYLGIPYSNDMDKGNRTLIQNNDVLEIEPDQSLLTKRYTEYAVDFINKVAEKSPFFLYLAHNMPHVPISASENFKGKSKAGLYGDVIEEIDWSVGQVIKAIEKNNELENTLLIFTSDNGPWLSYGNHGGSAGNLREGKSTVFEGGFRVPCIMSWPEKMPKGKVCDDFISTLDFLPTICHITNTELPKKKIDGINIIPVLRGEEMPELDNRYFYYYDGEKIEAVRKANWKYISALKYNNVTKPGKDGVQGDSERAVQEEALYNLKTDISESLNVIDGYPELVVELRSAMYAFDSVLKIEARPIGIMDIEKTITTNK
jgi:arylsulfatase